MHGRGPGALLPVLGVCTQGMHMYGCSHQGGEPERMQKPGQAVPELEFQEEFLLYPHSLLDASLLQWHIHTLRHRHVGTPAHPAA